MRLADPKGWIALAAIAGLACAVVAWGLFGSLATTVRGQGVLIRQASQVTSPVTGRVVAVKVASGAEVAPGDVVATIAQQGAGLVEVRSPFRERVNVVEVLTQEGDYVTPGAPIISTDKIDAPLRAVLYLPAGKSQQVQPGMPAAVYTLLSPIVPPCPRQEVRPDTPATVSLGPAGRAQYGVIRGRVRSVASAPSTVQGMTALLRNATLVQALFNAGGGTPLEVEVDLERVGTPCGVAWASSRGPAVPLRVGTLSTVDITLGIQHPVSLIFPAAQ